MSKPTHIYTGHTASYGVILVSPGKIVSTVQVVSYLDNLGTLPLGQNFVVSTIKLCKTN